MVTRRRVLRTGLTTVAAVSGTAAALRPMLTAEQPSAADGPADAAGSGDLPAAGHGPDNAAPPLFDEIYRERRIQGFGSDAESGLDIFIDGRALGLMRRVDGSWISFANHFQPYPTPLETARGAVDVIGRAELSMDAGNHH
jgi:hypothetical protein